MRQTQRQWLGRQVDNLPASVAKLLRAGHAARIGFPSPVSSSPLYAANQWLQFEASALRSAHAENAFDEAAIREHAENYSRTCARIRTLARRIEFAATVGVHVEQRVSPSAQDMAALSARLACPRWWRRQLRTGWTRAAENSMRELGAIRRHVAPYASNEAVRHRRGQRERGRQFLESHAVVNEVGEQLPLLDVSEKSVANPILRRGELMCRVRGFEELSKERGDVALFVTLTAPSAFHPWRADGSRNELHSRESVRDAQAWLLQMWARTRAKLKRLSIVYYGVRVAEPHHDGTPHWHVLVFLPAAQVETVRAVIRGHWLSEFSDEAGAVERRVTFETIDPNKGSAVGYVAKYVAKSIDGAGAIGEAPDNETGAPVLDSLARIDAWASVHGIRQFAQLGGPPVGLWRELRRLREPVAVERIEAAREAADRGAWAEYTRAVGGVERAGKRVARMRDRYGRPRLGPAPEQLQLPLVWLEKDAPRRTDPMGRDVLCTTRYGEFAPDRARGIVTTGDCGLWRTVATRPHRWHIERAACSAPVLSSDLGPVAITVRGPFDSNGSNSDGKKGPDTVRCGAQGDRQSAGEQFSRGERIREGAAGAPGLGSGRGDTG
jgi:hypothetical protein